MAHIVIPHMEGQIVKRLKKLLYLINLEKKGLILNYLCLKL